MILWGGYPPYKINDFRGDPMIQWGYQPHRILVPRRGDFGSRTHQAGARIIKHLKLQDVTNHYLTRKIDASCEKLKLDCIYLYNSLELSSKNKVFLSP